jgi:predicted nucleic acid-binding protein
VIALIDSSVVARQLLGEPEALDEWSQIEEAYGSRLLPLELGRLFDRLRLSGAVDDVQVVDLHQELRRILRSIGLVALTEDVLRCASGPMPTVIGSLDAIHLATASEVQRELGRTVTVATHDVQLARAARALGFPVVGA